MVTASPPVSPRVVAAILMTQKSRVTSGTLLRVAPAVSSVGSLSRGPSMPNIAIGSIFPCRLVCGIDDGVCWSGRVHTGVMRAVTAITILLFAGADAARGGGVPYHLVRTVALGAPDRWDYVTFD